ncbi:hypothetical protein KY316_00360, partial [Candidatus Woesearchaeota archaeon]|nr:hypothetical protein [Candidatus Woesearchaeota archaeon]
MKAIVFDTGPLISLSVNSLLWILYPLKKKFGGKFIITPEVKRELVDRPIRGKKYQFEALRIHDLLNEKVFEIHGSKQVAQRAKELMDTANSCFSVHGTNLKIVQLAEMESIAAALELKADAIVIDERTTRMLIESPGDIENILERKLSEDVKVDREMLRRFSETVKDIKVLRSTELVVAAYRLGLLDRYVTANQKVDKRMKNILLQSVLWALKLYG